VNKQTQARREMRANNKMKKNKYSYLFVVQGNYGYGHGWEDLCASENYKEARANLKDYRLNEVNTPHRLIRRRELNEVAA
jgi:hypothetical protein